MGHFKRAAVCALVATSFIAGGLAAEDASPFDFGGEMGVAASAEKSPQEQAGRAAYSPRETERRIEEALSQRLRAPIEAVDHPLNILMTVISQDYGIPIVFDAPALDEVAISPDVEVNLGPIANISLRSALELLLHSAGAEDLTYIIDKEVLIITTRERAEARLEVKVYQIADLMTPREPEPAGASAWSDFNRVVDIITSCAEPHSWRENGTGEGDVRYLPPGVLVVLQTPRVHDQIENLLQSIRSARAAIATEAEARQTKTAVPAVTRGFVIDAAAAGESERVMNRLYEVITKSVDWEVTGTEITDEDIFLYVTPRRVMVRHRPEVVRQVEGVIGELQLRGMHIAGGYGGGGFGGVGGFGGRGGGESKAATEPTKGGGQF